MKRVGITTDRFDTVAPHYAARGLLPVELTCIRVDPAPSPALAEARSAAAAADLLVLTSARAVVLLWPDTPLPDVPVAAVGSATAMAVRDHGGVVSLTGDGGLDRLVDVLGDRFATAAVAYPHAAGTDRRALARLRGRCSGLEERVVYATVPVSPPADVVEAVTFASPSAVSGWLLARSLDGLVVGAIGATTAAALRTVRPPDVTAPQPTHASLAEAMAVQLEVAS